MISVTSPTHSANWPSTRILREALSTVTQTGTVVWGASPCDKLEALQRLSTAGVLTPEISLTLPSPAAGWLGRLRNHSRGKDILFPPSSIACASYRRAYQERDFWVRFIPSRREFRVHVWAGHADRIGFKQQTSPLARDQRLHRVVRASQRGWELCYNYDSLCEVTSKEERKELRRLSRETCTVLGVVGGAVDLLQGEDGRFYVLELNTAPALGPNTLDHYVRRICEAASGTTTEVPSPPPERPPSVRAVAAVDVVWDDEEGEE